MRIRCSKTFCLLTVKDKTYQSLQVLRQGWQATKVLAQAHSAAHSACQATCFAPQQPDVQTGCGLLAQAKFFFLKISKSKFDPRVDRSWIMFNSIREKDKFPGENNCLHAKIRH